MARHEHSRAVAARLARLGGHIRAVQRMVEEGRPCSEVLVQMAAVRSALDRAAKLLLADHMEHCVLDSTHGGNPRRNLSELRKALERFME